MRRMGSFKWPTVIVLVATIITGVPTPRSHAEEPLPTSRPAQPKFMRIMSFNIRYGTAKDGDDAWDKRKTFLADTVKAFDPDLLGTQEVLHAQAEYLKEALPGYGFVGRARDDGKEKGEYSPIMYRKARFDPTDSGQFWLSETPNEVGSKGWDAALPRICTWVLLKDKATGGAVLYFNSHWDHIGKVARRESGKLMRRRIEQQTAKTKETGGGALSVVVTGDFNSTEDTDAYKALLGEDGAAPRLLDSYREAHAERKPDEASFHSFTGKRQGSRIDFILHSPDWAAARSDIDYTAKDGRYPSDHFPVTAVLEPKRP